VCMLLLSLTSCFTEETKDLVWAGREYHKRCVSTVTKALNGEEVSVSETVELRRDMAALSVAWESLVTVAGEPKTIPMIGVMP